MTARFDPASATFDDAQRDLRHAYYDGAPGVLVSGLTWLMASLVTLNQGAASGMWALLIGGMFIHPVALLLTRLLGRPARHSAGNPLGVLALATTVWMILSMALALGCALYRIEWFFPAMLLVIGGRYLTFSTLYGARLYLVFGATLALAGVALGMAHARPELGVFAGAGIEVLFAVLLFTGARRRLASVN